MTDAEILDRKSRQRLDGWHNSAGLQAMLLKNDIRQAIDAIDVALRYARFDDATRKAIIESREYETARLDLI